MKLPRFFLTLIVLASTVLAACQPAAPKASGNVSFMVSGDPAELAAYQKVVDAFEVKHPEIKVEVIQVPDDEEYISRLEADIAAGTPSDIILFDYDELTQFFAKDAFAPLTQYLANSKLIKESDFYPEAIAPFKWKGQLMCIPLNISSLVVYYNKEMFDAAGVRYPSNGWTWDDFLADAQKLTKDTNGDGQTDQFGVGIAPEFMSLAPFIWQAGGEIVDNPSNPSALTLTTDPAIAAAKFFTELQTVHHVVPNAEQETSEDSQSRFINGRTAMYFNSRRSVTTFRESVKFDWDVAALPQF